jgi:hypothetical protein
MHVNHLGIETPEMANSLLMRNVPNGATGDTESVEPTALDPLFII